jgi:hypothetical protein
LPVPSSTRMLVKTTALMTMSSFVVLIIGGLLPKKTYFYCVSNVFFLLASRPEQGNRVNIGKWNPDARPFSQPRRGREEDSRRSTWRARRRLLAVRYIAVANLATADR